jgi:hypothetical protein
MPGYDEINWEEAACEGAPTNLFYIIEEDKRVINLIGLEPTRRICGSCPIWKACLSYAMQNESYGMWGGLISKERNALKKRDGAQLRENAIRELTKYGIERREIEAIADEHTDNERSVENEFTYYGENDSLSNR